MAFSVGNYGITLSGDMNFNDASCNIINNKIKQISFIEPAGSPGSIFTCNTFITPTDTTPVNVLQIARSSGVWGGLYIECIIYGTHNTNPGFANKWEFMLRTAETSANVFSNAIYQGTTAITSGNNLTRINVGSGAVGVMPSLRQTTSATTTTFSVVPPTSLTGNFYVVSFRIMNGSGTIYDYTVY
jgi:hypothetical protein